MCVCVCVVCCVCVLVCVCVCMYVCGVWYVCVILRDYCIHVNFDIPREL